MASHASVPSRGLPPKPPDKGSFPLDHFGECSDAKVEYMRCLKQHNMQAQTDECRELSAKYLKCRMERCARAHAGGAGARA
jgi:cytochrome c oxidase assembly protein subunit 19